MTSALAGALGVGSEDDEALRERARLGSEAVEDLAGVEAVGVVGEVLEGVPVFGDGCQVLLVVADGFLPFGEGGVVEGEVAFGDLRWSDVLLDRGEILIQQQLQWVRRRLLQSEVKTDASESMLPLPEICRAALLLRQKRREADKLAAGELWTDSDLVFTTRYGTPIEPRNFNRRFEFRCKEAVVRLIRVHDTRKTCGTLLAALDVHPRVAMQILRHSQFAVTMEIYTQVPSEETRKALRKLGATLDTAQAGTLAEGEASGGAAAPGVDAA
ncbi:site-specific integrase [Kitasatospora kifunensis]|uniref:Tyr recombinase domain-containing protein n=1 Tax=Kitasatospora kifunensis TaxID=58351 RepID=A0A7W7R3J5_KITKI|nr:tyrosine-type recombinase/integrase [Kitasatospora kifunensis]MBB4924760.1 hypothetical protein [Kitasatospora kifunensis]